MGAWLADLIEKNARQRSEILGPLEAKRRCLMEKRLDDLETDRLRRSQEAQLASTPAELAIVDAKADHALSLIHI